MENKKPKKFLSIKTKITFSIVVFVLMTLSIVFSVSYLNTRKSMREDLDLRLLNMVNIAVLHVDVDKHSALKTLPDESTQNYLDVKMALRDVRDHSTDIRYIYTMRENEDKEIYFVVDAEEDPTNISHLGEVYEDPNQFLIDNFSKINKPVAEKEFTSDKWGTWISGYAPFYDKNGNREGVLGIDIKASDIISKQKELFYIYIISFIISGILSIILGLYLSRRLVNSITFLTSILKGHNKDGIIGISPIGNDEVGDFTNVLKTTLDQINITQKNTEEKVSDKTKMLEKMNKLMIGRELEMIKLKKEVSELKKKIGNNIN